MLYGYTIDEVMEMEREDLEAFCLEELEDIQEMLETEWKQTSEKIEALEALDDAKFFGDANILEEYDALCDYTHDFAEMWDIVKDAISTKW